MRFELIISSFHVLIQDWCLTTTALEAKLRTSGIEPELCDWKSHSLPLTYIRSTIIFVPLFKVKIRPSGIEPESPAWQADILPLNHDRNYKWRKKHRVGLFYKFAHLIEQNISPENETHPGKHLISI